MRTNIEIDDELMAEVQEMSQLPTKRAVVDAALRDYRRRLISTQAQLELLAMAGNVKFFEGYDPEEGDEQLRDERDKSKD